MKVYVNQDCIELSSQATLLDCIQKIGIENQQGIAVAINDIVVPKDKWGHQELVENDRILIIRATQGG